MASGDGLLVRLAPADGLSAGAARGAGAGGARGFGNGLIEVTARGSLQVRGLRPETAPALAAEVEALGIALPDGPPVLVGRAGGARSGARSPIRGRWRRRCAGSAGPLPPKVSVVVDGGGALHLDGGGGGRAGAGDAAGGSGR